MIGIRGTLKHKTRSFIRKLTPLILLGLTSCAATHNRLEGPVVDLTGVDPVKHNRDMGECTQKKREASFVGAATMITDCMAERGYVIITPKG
jgi:hypothetical protein